MNETSTGLFFELDVNPTKMLKCRSTRNGNVQISIFKKFQITNKNLPNAQTELRFKKIEDVILDKEKTNKLVSFLKKFAN